MNPYFLACVQMIFVIVFSLTTSAALVPNRAIHSTLTMQSSLAPLSQVQVINPENIKSEKIVLASGDIAYVLDNYGLFIPGSTYRKLNSKLIEQENGKTVSVPIEYSKPNGRKLELYYLSVLPFDPKKPTMIYVEGGPGGTAHALAGWFRELAKSTQANIIMFDARGIGLSSPELPTDYLGYTMWGSDFIAHDMKAILDDLQVTAATVYGISYGTVPATLFAHLYPKMTRSVILEGVMGDESTSKQRSPRLASLLNKRIVPFLNAAEKQYLESVYPIIRYKMRMGNLIGAYQADFISSYVRVRMAYDASMIQSGNVAIPQTDENETIFLNVLQPIYTHMIMDLIASPLNKREIDSIIRSPEFLKQLQDKMLQKFGELQNANRSVPAQPALRGFNSESLTASNSSILPTEYPILNDLKFDLMMLQRILGLNLSDSLPSILSFSAKSGFKSEVLLNDEAAQRMIELYNGIRKSVGQEIFDPRRLAISAPVYYFQGTGDDATEFSGASYHYKNSPTTSAYFFAFKNAGHTPLMAIHPQKRGVSISVYNSAIAGKAPTVEQILGLSSNVFPVAYTDKAGNGVTVDGRVLPIRMK